MHALLVLTNLPDRAAAERLADALIEKRVAACVNILGPCRSVYRWEGELSEDTESLLLVKTTQERYEALERRVRELHPYQIPEILALGVGQTPPEFAAWLEGSVRG